MSKYIDANDLINRLDGEKYRIFREILHTEPESIVRCKDCKHRQKDVGMGDHRWCDIVNGSRHYDDFCSYGERKEE